MKEGQQKQVWNTGGAPAPELCSGLCCTLQRAHLTATYSRACQRTLLERSQSKHLFNTASKEAHSCASHGAGRQLPPRQQASLCLGSARTLWRRQAHTLSMWSTRTPSHASSTCRTPTRLCSAAEITGVMPSCTKAHRHTCACASSCAHVPAETQATPLCNTSKSTCMCTHTHTHRCTHALSHTHTHTHTDARTLSHTHTKTHARSHTHT